MLYFVTLIQTRTSWRLSQIIVTCYTERASLSVLTPVRSSFLQSCQGRWQSDNTFNTLQIEVTSYLWDFKFSRRRVWSSVSSLIMEAARTSETSVDNYFTRQYIPEDNSELQPHTSTQISGLYICSLFNNAFPVTKIIHSRMKGWGVNDKLGNIWKGTMVA
jgi:hypothetical protein